MLYLTHIPKAPLCEFVELFWYYEGYTQPHAKERIMPDGSMELVINLREDESRIYDTENPELFDRYSGSILAGPRSGFFVIDTVGQASVIGIHFRPGGVSRFLKLPLNELQNQCVTLDCLWGRAGADFRNRVLEAPTPEARLRVLEQCLLEQTARPMEQPAAVRGALHYISHQLAGLSVADLAGHIGLGRRRFIQVFSEEVGLTPKLFCRVRRFQQVLHSIHGRDDIDWADVALGCGYFDQAHFNHDFRAFSGINPSTYLRHRTDHLNHVPLLD
jgi:AraC-like DNA-binding protein